MKSRHNQIIEKILKIFTNTGFGVEMFNEDTYDIIDRSVIGKAKIGSVKVLDSGEISIRLGGEAKKHNKFASLMKITSIKIKPNFNMASAAKMVKDMLSEYKSAKKIVYKESYNEINKNIIIETTRNTLETIIDEYLYRITNNNIEESYADLVTFVADKLNLNEDEVEVRFGDVLNNTINYDEDRYTQSMNKLYSNNELKNHIKQYLKENTFNDLFDTIKADKALKTLRNTDSYKNLDEEEKYRKIWKYVVRTHGDKFDMSEDLEDICHKIAEEDEDLF